MKKRKEFADLGDENIRYVEEHQWPPISYLKDLEVYEKAIGKTDGIRGDCQVM